jgi:hypothetical protein
MHLYDAILTRGIRVLLAGASLLVLSSCGKKQETAQEPAAAGGHHAHVAPHGGTLVEVGEHMFNIELVHDADAGRLTAYILDAHAENFVRLPIQGFAIIALVNGRRESLPMAAVANPVTGETVGDTSEFSATAAWLKGKVACDAYIPAIDIRGTTFKDVRFAFRSPAPAK